MIEENLALGIIGLMLLFMFTSFIKGHREWRGRYDKQKTRY